MKRAEIIVGRFYRAKVAGKLTTVRIDRDLGVDRWNPNGHRGWAATNVTTNREIRIRTAARLRLEIKHEPSIPQS